ncbi:MAG: hypothetical protein AB7I50_19535 [Vicinamibacterales bacterium]
MTFAIGLLIFGLAVVWLFKKKQSDVRACASILRLVPAARETVRKTTPEGFAATDILLLRGELEGFPVTLWERTVRHPLATKWRRMGSQFTVLTFTLGSAVAGTLRLQPRGMLGALEVLIQGRPDAVGISPDFDEAYTTYTSDERRARHALTVELQHELLAFRARVAGPLTGSVAGQMASGLMLGTIAIEEGQASYVLFGSPAKAVADHLLVAAPLVRAVATRFQSSP